MALDVHTAHGQALTAHAASVGSVTHCDPVAQLAEGIALEIKVLQQLHDLILGSLAGRHVMLVVGIHVLVEPTIGDRMAVGFDHDEERDELLQLQGLIKGTGAILADPFAYVANLSPFPFSARRRPSLFAISAARSDSA
jgi:hypothetical protein